MADPRRRRTTLVPVSFFARIFGHHLIQVRPKTSGPLSALKPPGATLERICGRQFTTTTDETRYVRRSDVNTTELLVGDFQQAVGEISRT